MLLCSLLSGKCFVLPPALNRYLAGAGIYKFLFGKKTHYLSFCLEVAFTGSDETALVEEDGSAKAAE